MPALALTKYASEYTRGVRFNFQNRNKWLVVTRFGGEYKTKIFPRQVANLNEIRKHIHIVLYTKLRISNSFSRFFSSRKLEIFYAEDTDVNPY